MRGRCPGTRPATPPRSGLVRRRRPRGARWRVAPPTTSGRRSPSRLRAACAGHIPPPAASTRLASVARQRPSPNPAGDSRADPWRAERSRPLGTAFRRARAAGPDSPGARRVPRPGPGDNRSPWPGPCRCRCPRSRSRPPGARAARTPSRSAAARRVRPAPAARARRRAAPRRRGRSAPWVLR